MKIRRFLMAHDFWKITNYDERKRERKREEKGAFFMLSDKQDLVNFFFSWFDLTELLAFSATSEVYSNTCHLKWLCLVIILSFSPWTAVFLFVIGLIARDKLVIKMYSMSLIWTVVVFCNVFWLDWSASSFSKHWCGFLTLGSGYWKRLSHLISPS